MSSSVVTVGFRRMALGAHSLAGANPGAGKAHSLQASGVWETATPFSQPKWAAGRCLGCKFISCSVCWRCMAQLYLFSYEWSCLYFLCGMSESWVSWSSSRVITASLSPWPCAHVLSHDKGRIGTGSLGSPLGYLTQLGSETSTVPGHCSCSTSRYSTGLWYDPESSSSSSLLEPCLENLKFLPPLEGLLYTRIDSAAPKGSGLKPENLSRKTKQKQWGSWWWFKEIALKIGFYL